MAVAKNRRILVIDDDDAIHDDLRAALALCTGMQLLEAAPTSLLGGGKPSARHEIAFEIDSAYQRDAGLQRVRDAHTAGRPYALAFLDIRTSAGYDGVETIRNLRAIDPQLQVAVCTSGQDHSWGALVAALGHCDWLLVLQRPFEAVEVQQLACALTEKWNLGRRATMRAEELEIKVQLHANQLAAANESLKEQVASLAKVNSQLADEMAARRQADERMLHIAFHDALTDLPNRLLLMERIAGCINRRKTQYGYQFAVLYCDLDNFKVINDSLGHRVGDKVLVHVARCLNDAVGVDESASQRSSRMVARLGGDEFVVLVAETPNEEYAFGVAERIRDVLAKPIAIDHHELVLGVSVGVAMSGEASDAADVLRDADTALYAAKERGRGCAALFDAAMRAKSKARMELEQQLRRAIELEQFVVHYQPIFSLETEQVVGVEALVRWNHPTRGLLDPIEFVPVAEETGIIDGLGALVLGLACTNVAAWRRTIPGMEQLKVSVNVSPRQLANRDIVATIDRCLADTQLEPSALRLEVTETALNSDVMKAHRVIEELVQRGVEIHLDDFGTGYSSMSMFHTLPFSTIKLDRSFVSHLSDELESATTVQALVMLAQHEGLKIVAEGIESADQLAKLRDLDCAYGQGFYFSRPLPAGEAQTYLSDAAQRATKGPAVAWPHLAESSVLLPFEADA